MKMALKVKRETPVPPKAEAKAKALKAKKAVSTATKKIRSGHHQPSGGPKYCDSGGSPNTLGRAPTPRRNKLDTMPSSPSSQP